MFKFVLLLILVLNFVLVDCTSSGQFISLCDALSPLYGCDPANWGNGNRKNCTEEGQIMAWASKPYETDDYTITLGANEKYHQTSYSPDELIPVQIRARTQYLNYRGLMMYAEDDSKVRVGSWEIPKEVPAIFKVTSDTDPCDKTVFHNSGVVKPYLYTLFFRAPSTPVGKITFRALIKFGDANTGAFYYPRGAVSGTISLQPSSDPFVPLTWVKSNLGESCTSVCNTVGGTCNLGVLNQINSSLILADSIARSHLCKLPFLSNCNALGVTSSYEGYCYYGSSEASCNAQQRVFEETDCDASSSRPGIGYRLCYCGEDVDIGLQTYDTNPPTYSEPTPTTSNSPTKSVSQSATESVVVTKTVSQVGSDSNGNTFSVVETQSESVEQTVSKSVTSSETSAAGEKCLQNSDCESGICGISGLCFVDNNSSANSLNNLFSFAIIGLFTIFKFSSKTAILILSIVLCFINGANAHNWLSGPSRSMDTASTTTPCPLRTTAKPNVQVGPGQHFQVEWAIGHLATTHLILIDALDEGELGKHTEEFLQGYVDDAITEGVENLAQTDTYAKRHRGPAVALQEDAIEREILEGDSNYLVQPDEFKNPLDWNLYEYKTDNTAVDHVYSYANVKYPWIMSLYKFRHEFDSPETVDVTNLIIPDGSDFGRYIVHYVWRGYRDCVEVDYIDQQVEYIYGLIGEGTVWNVIPHCLFVDPQNVITKCLDPLGTLGECFQECGYNQQACSGINIVPYKVPNSAYEGFRNQSILDCEMGEKWNEYSEAEKQDILVCYGLEPKIPTATEFYYIVSLDPQDPIFYSTCFHREADKTFIGDDAFTRSSGAPDWRYVNQCIGCKNREYNRLSYIPYWEISDICVNCDEEPVPEVTTYELVAEDQSCGASQGCGECTKRIFSWNRGHDTRTLAEEDCFVLAQRHTECGRTFWFQDGGDSGSCYCLLDTECCNTEGCNLQSNDGWDTFELIN